MAKNVELLLTESVEALGIVGDVVKVRTGYARNYLLPRGYATTPSEEKIKELAAKRAEAERQLAELRRVREDLVQRLNGYELNVVRSCNDQGILYGAVTQQEIAAALTEAGFGVRPRDVRLGQTIKRVDTYDVHIKFEADLEAVIKLWVMPDRKLELREEAAEGEAAPAPEAGEGSPAPEAGAEATTEKKKSRKSKGEDGAAAGAAPAEAAKESKSTGGWGKAASKPDLVHGTKHEKSGETKADRKAAAKAAKDAGDEKAEKAEKGRKA
jgi:large subunit ribosomal protein L9